MIHTCISVHLSIFVNSFIHIPLHKIVYMSMYTYIYQYTYLYVYVYAHVCHLKGSLQGSHSTLTSNSEVAQARRTAGTWTPCSWSLELKSNDVPCPCLGPDPLRRPIQIIRHIWGSKTISGAPRVDSRKLEHKCMMIYAGLCSLAWGWRRVMFQLSTRTFWVVQPATTLSTRMRKPKGLMMDGLANRSCAGAACHATIWGLSTA